MPRRRKNRAGMAHKAASDAMTEIGNAGLKIQSGKVIDQVNRLLRSPRDRNKIYAEIGSNSIVGPARLAIEQLLRQVDIRVTAASDDNADLEARDFVRSCLTDMSRTWDDTITQALTMLDFGHAPMEVVLKRRQGDHADPARRSQYSDGRIGWRKVALRPPTSIDRWDFDADDGGFTGFYQRDPSTSREVFIPIEKSLLFRTRDNGSPEGVSVYRNCVFPWVFVKRLQEIEAIGVERDLTGIPVAEIPIEFMSASATPEQVATREAFKELITSMYRNENEGIVIGQQYDANGNPRFKVSLMTTGGRRAFDVGAIIQRYEQRMLMCLLADFILLGHEKVGSFSLSSDKTDLFAVAIAAWLDSILAVWNRFAIPRLLRVNGMNAGAPKLVRGDIEKQDIAGLGTYILNLANAGIMLDDSDGQLSRALVSAAGLPVPAVEGEDEGAMPVGKRANLEVGVMRSLAAEVQKLRKELKDEAA